MTDFSSIWDISKRRTSYNGASKPPVKKPKANPNKSFDLSVITNAVRKLVKAR